MKTIDKFLIILNLFLIIFGLFVLYQIIRKILGGSWGTEQSILALLILNITITFGIVAIIGTLKSDLKFLRLQFNTLAKDFKPLLKEFHEQRSEFKLFSKEFHEQRNEIRKLSKELYSLSKGFRSYIEHYN